MASSYDYEFIFGQMERHSELFPRAYESGPERTFIPILNASVGDYREAVGDMIRDWLEDKNELGRPTNKEDREMIGSVNDRVNLRWSAFGTREEVRRIQNILFFMGFYKYLKTITKHRTWIRNCYQLIKEAGVEIMLNLGSLIDKHDLSKFTYPELLGYTIMFNAKKQPWRVYKNDDKNFEWTSAVKNHHLTNPYHPEYHVEEPEGACKEPVQSRFRAVDGYSAEQLLAESVLEMIACNGEKNQKSRRFISISKLFDIDPACLERYHVDDRRIVEGYLKDWKSKTLEFLSTGYNIVCYQRHFDWRNVQL